jgi:hypothetical protein
MEYLIVGTVFGLGYLFNKDGINREEEVIEEVPENLKPNGINIYENNNVNKIRQNEQKIADKLYEKTKDSINTNIIIPGPPKYDNFNKVDYTDNKLPIEFNTEPTINNIKSNNNTNEISLTGEPIDKNNFIHNNMTPFFGGSIKQNVDDYANQELFENFTGTDSTYQKKKEIAPLFKPKTNVTNPYGLQSLDGFMNERYVVGNIRNNISPLEKIYVGPGLNKGYNNDPTGGFQQADTRDYVLPKTVNETRVKTNPKVSYYGRIISGEKINKPGKIGCIEKNRPDTFFIENPDRYFTTTGNCIAARQRPNIVMKYVNRPKNEKKSRIGPAGTTHGSSEPVRSKVKNSTKQQLSKYANGIINATGKWNSNNSSNSDYGKSNIKLPCNKRNLTCKNNRNGNLQFSEKFGSSKRNNQRPRFTRKTNVIGNPRWSGNVNGISNKGSVIYDPNDIARATIKETNIHNNRKGNLNSTGPNKGTVYDPNDIARTTIKETNIHNNRKGNLNSTGPNKGTVYDPNDITRTTIKETNIHNNRKGNLNSTGPNKGTVYDPNDIARTTIKETNIHNNRKGNLNSTGPNKGIVYDPNDITRTTIKETNIHNNRDGNISEYKRSPMRNPNERLKVTTKQTTLLSNLTGNIEKQNRNDAYKDSNIEAIETNRQFTSREYAGDAQGSAEGGYQVTETEAPNTNRQFTTDLEYSGIAGGGSEMQPMSYSDIYNSTIKSIRDETSIERVPGAQAPNKPISVDKINMTTNKQGDLQNCNLQNRGNISTKVYNSIPQTIVCGQTKDKETVPNKPIADRLNPNILDAFKNNPYTQPLDSFFYN